jgi:hypothetical protein
MFVVLNTIITSMVMMIRSGPRRVVLVLWCRGPLPILEDLSQLDGQRTHNPAPERDPGNACLYRNLTNACAIPVKSDDLILLVGRKSGD